MPRKNKIIELAIQSYRNLRFRFTFWPFFGVINPIRNGKTLWNRGKIYVCLFKCYS